MITVEKKPPWIAYVKAIGLFLLSYSAVEAGRYFFAIGPCDPSSSYYLATTVIGFLVWLIAVLYEKYWEKSP